MRNQAFPASARVNLFNGLVLLTAVTLSGCQQASSSPQGRPPAPVAVVTVEPKDIPVVFEYTGQTAGSREVEVRARVTGILQKRNYQEGEPVKGGQSLFSIDAAPYRATLTRAEADVSAADARLDLAQRNEVRMQRLYQDKAVSKKDYDDAVSNKVIARADLKAARAQLTEARLDLKYTRVESPITGIAGRALRSDGNYVTGPEVLLTRVTQIDPIYVLFGISDDERLKMHRETQAGQLVLPKNDAYTVTVHLAEGMEYTRTGKLNFSGVLISDTTGTSESRAELPNPDGLLRPGQFVRVSLKGAHRPGAILVPQRAVLEGPRGKFVYLMKDGKAAAQPVGVGDWQGDNWIITSGLKAGDQVIVDGVMKIGPGAPVQVAAPEKKKDKAPLADNE